MVGDHEHDQDDAEGVDIACVGEGDEPGTILARRCLPIFQGDLWKFPSEAEHQAFFLPSFSSSTAVWYFRRMSARLGVGGLWPRQPRRVLPGSQSEAVGSACPPPR